MSCKIILNKSGIFGPGDYITGKAICTFNTQEHIRGIICKFRGREQTHWVQRRGKHNVHYTGSNDVVVADSLLLGETDIQPGVYEYQFGYALPPSNIPSSYSHKLGSIRYFIQVYVDRPFAFDYKDEVTFHVVSPLVLAVPPNEQNMQPISYQVEKDVGCCCSVEMITMNVTLERDTYVFGEVVNVKVEIINKSNVEVQGIRVDITTNILFTAHSPSTQTKTDKVPILMVTDTGVNANQRRSYNFNLRIPETVIIPTFRSTLLFKEWCVLTVKAELPPFHSDLICQSNINVGHPGFVNYVPPTRTGTNVVPRGVAAPDSLVPTAPRELNEPTAPRELNEDFTVIGGDPIGKFEPPPPSYDDIMKQHSPSRL